MPISTEVSASAATALASGPACTPRRPAAFGQRRSPPRGPSGRRRTPARRSRWSASLCSLWAATLWKAATTRAGVAEALLRGERGGVFGRQLHARDLRRHQRHGGVDDELAGDVRLDLVEDGGVAGPRHGQQHDPRRPWRPRRWWRPGRRSAGASWRPPRPCPRARADGRRCSRPWPAACRGRSPACPCRR